MTAPTMMPDQLRVLLNRIAARDDIAFRQLYEATSANLFGLALRIVMKPERAEDVLQESFLSVWNHAATYRSNLAAPMTWLTTIVRNKAFDLLRRLDDVIEIDADAYALNEAALQALMEKNALLSDVSTASAAALLESGQDAVALSGCLMTLEGPHRQAIALAFFHDLSHSEVASQLALPLGTAKTWIRRGLVRLRQCLAGSMA